MDHDQTEEQSAPESPDSGLADCAFIPPFLLRFLRIERIHSIRVTAESVVGGETVVRHDEQGEWTRSSWLFWMRLSFANSGTDRLHFHLPTEAAESFLAIAEAWRTRVAQGHTIDAAQTYLQLWNELMGLPRFIARHEIVEWISEAELLHGQLYAAYDKIRLVEARSPVFLFQALMRDPWAAAARRNDDYVRRELARTAAWFDTFKVPPTSVQREVAIRDETNSLVVAGAGTGKTSTIATKIRYLLETKLAIASRMLVVAFNTDAAQEIRDRCAAAGHDGVTVLTFHALGLHILATEPGEKPPVLSELQTEQGRDDLISQLVDKLSADEGFAQEYARFVLLHARPTFSEFEADSESSYVTKTKASLSKSLHGEWVRSSQELRIANWLFLHGVRYEYEAIYPHAQGSGYTRYRPDFTLRVSLKDTSGVELERVIYLEHQALNERGEAPAWMKGYRQKVDFCRTTHGQHKTTLVESFSWWFSKGIWEKELRKVLEKSGLVIPAVDWRTLLQTVESGHAETISFERRTVNGLLRRVLDLSRAGNEKDGDRRLFAGESAADAARQDLFRRLFRPVRDAYEEHKRRRQGIDFEDMIALARQTVAHGKFKAAWTHYIIDEFQDASLSRLDLILGLRNQVSGSRLTCVGDDWQAIIRFAGGDIRVMTEFEQRVGPFWRANLDQAFRYSRTIAEVSAKFVIANPQQLRKSIAPAAKVKNRPVRIVMAAHKSDSGEFNDVLFQELGLIAKEKPDASVLLLSRYRRGIPGEDVQAKVRAAFPHLILDCSTVHRAKGREADAVIVGDLNDGAWGFPCLREDDPIIRAFLPPADAYEHAEERRLFYVALTRARQFAVLIADGGAPSPFVRELMQGSYGTGVEVKNLGGASKLCPRCKVGYVVSRYGPYGLFYSCTKSPACAHTEKACPTCRMGFLDLAEGRYRCSRAEAGCQHTAEACPRCRRGMLERRTNRQNGNQFLGCSRFFDEESPCTYTSSSGGGRR